MCGCAVSRRYVDVCDCDLFRVVYVYLDHLKLCVLMNEGMSVVVNVMLSLMSASAPPRVCCVVNKQFELLEFVFDSVYVDLQ